MMSKRKFVVDDCVYIAVVYCFVYFWCVGVGY